LRSLFFGGLVLLRQLIPRNIGKRASATSRQPFFSFPSFLSTGSGAASRPHYPASCPFTSPLPSLLVSTYTPRTDWRVNLFPGTSISFPAILLTNKLPPSTLQGSVSITAHRQFALHYPSFRTFPYSEPSTLSLPDFFNFRPCLLFAVCRQFAKIVQTWSPNSDCPFRPTRVRVLSCPFPSSPQYYLTIVNVTPHCRL